MESKLHLNLKRMMNTFIECFWLYFKYASDAGYPTYRINFVSLKDWIVVAFGQICLSHVNIFY